MLNETYLEKRLKRIYEECEKAQERKDNYAAVALIDAYNKLIELIIEDRKKYEIIISYKAGELISHPDYADHTYATKLEEIKMSVLNIADALEIDMNRLNKIASPQTQQIIVTQSNDQKSNNSNENTNIVQQTNLNKQFEDEINKETPDANILKIIFNQMKDAGVKITPILIEQAIKRGIQFIH